MWTFPRTTLRSYRHSIMAQLHVRDGQRDFDFETTVFPTVELRRYRTKPGRRDELIDLFEEHFIESQEACGMVPLGHFRDIDDPDLFVWLRGFPSFDTRASALAAFYIDSTAWKTHRDAANDTMLDSDDVLLLAPARPETSFDTRGLVRPGIGEQCEEPRMLWLSLVMLKQQPSETIVRAFESTALPSISRLADNLSYLVTEQRANEFPRLPVREGEHALVACGLCDSRREIDACLKEIDNEFIPLLAESVLHAEHRRLRPARRSLLR
jgi:hypothetical protein